ncbi:MAG: hypothetical protein AB7I41_14670 [Candidatus Sericytochromatia bacterium]
MKKIFASAFAASLIALNLGTPQVQAHIAPFQLAQATEDDGYAVMERVSEFITTWESADIKKLEFMLHNSFVSGAGENKSKYLARLRKEAANSAGRKITMLWQGSKGSATKATATILMGYEEQYKNYSGSKFYSSCQKVTFDLTKWTDGNWYFTREKAAKGQCPP